METLGAAQDIRRSSRARLRQLSLDRRVVVTWRVFQSAVSGYGHPFTVAVHWRCDRGRLARMAMAAAIDRTIRPGAGASMLRPTRSWHVRQRREPGRFAGLVARAGSSVRNCAVCRNRRYRDEDCTDGTDFSSPQRAWHRGNRPTFVWDLPFPFGVRGVCGPPARWVVPRSACDVRVEFRQLSTNRTAASALGLRRKCEGFKEFAERVTFANRRLDRHRCASKRSDVWPGCTNT